jgi:serine/threonine protein kinase
MQTNIASIPIAESTMSLDSLSDYGELLQYFGLKSKKVEYYFQVGEIEKTQGWILHLSVVLSQMTDLLQLVIPFLAQEAVPFKIVVDDTIGEDVLNGNLGVAQIGKIVSIYPRNNATALSLGKRLIDLTKSFRGPAVPTDICLGNIVYTRYGSFNAVLKPDKNGIQEKYIYSQKGELIKDPYSIPFQFLKDLEWPFKELADPVLPDPPKLENRLYKVLDILKSDPRGNVFRGLYVKSLFQVKKCVLKQGFKNSASDKAGRDICDRLAWQAELYKELSATVPMPAIYDLIYENSFALLIMEYINGVSLYQKAQDINPNSKSWFELLPEESLSLVNDSIKITQIVGEMHKQGYLHRDITPVNFLIDKKSKIVLIDIELAYAHHQNRPNPPFRLGTPGFMSPEQNASERPTTAQDVYSLGATLLWLFTGLTPIKFNSKTTKLLSSSLEFFIGNKEIAETIANCLHHDPMQRPDIVLIKDALDRYQRPLKIKSKSYPNRPQQILSEGRLEKTILAALDGLTKSPIISKDEVWCSKKITIQNYTSKKSKEYAVSSGLAEGLCGPIYLLARLHKVGMTVDACKQMFKKSFLFLENRYLMNISELSPGLYKGAAGIALTLAESIQSGLIENNELNKERIIHCLEIPNEELNLSRGMAGQGVSILHCSDLINKDALQRLLTNIVNRLLNLQQSNGSWIDYSKGNSNEKNKIFEFGTDDTGIIWFLLEYTARYPNQDVLNAVEKALASILSNKERIKAFYDLVASKAGYEWGDGGKGMILVLIKAYETLQDEIYRKTAENALLKFPASIVTANFTQQNGLAAVGELYQEASHVFKNEKWQIRIDWIVNVFLYTFFSGEGESGYWQLEENNPPTADLLTGISGIIHFLARRVYPSGIGYRLLK